MQMRRMRMRLSCDWKGAATSNEKFAAIFADCTGSGFDLAGWKGDDVGDRYSVVSTANKLHDLVVESMPDASEHLRRIVAVNVQAACLRLHDLVVESMPDVSEHLRRIVCR